jgi:hypothetical protein
MGSQAADPNHRGVEELDRHNGTGVRSGNAEVMGNEAFEPPAPGVGTPGSMMSPLRGSN